MQTSLVPVRFVQRVGISSPHQQPPISVPAIEKPALPHEVAQLSSDSPPCVESKCGRQRYTDTEITSAPNQSTLSTQSARIIFPKEHRVMPSITLTFVGSPEQSLSKIHPRLVVGTQFLTM